jgi:hypothetical protein
MSGKNVGLRGWRPTRRPPANKLISVVVGLGALLAMAVPALAEVATRATGSAPAEGVSILDVPTCPDGHGCMWHQADFNGERRAVDAALAGTGWRSYVDGWGFRSAKNRFSGRPFLVRAAPNDPEQRCMDPGENRSSMPIMFEFRVGNVGGRC